MPAVYFNIQGKPDGRAELWDETAQCVAGAGQVSPMLLRALNIRRGYNFKLSQRRERNNAIQIILTKHTTSANSYGCRYWEYKASDGNCITSFICETGLNAMLAHLNIVPEIGMILYLCNQR